MKGLILEERNNFFIVLSNEGDFVRLNKKGFLDKEVGEELFFTPSDLHISSSKYFFSLKNISRRVVLPSFVAVMFFICVYNPIIAGMLQDLIGEKGLSKFDFATSEEISKETKGNRDTGDNKTSKPSEKDKSSIVISSVENTSNEQIPVNTSVTRSAETVTRSAEKETTVKGNEGVPSNTFASSTKPYRNIDKDFDKTEEEPIPPLDFYENVIPLNPNEIVPNPSVLSPSIPIIETEDGIVAGIEYEKDDDTATSNPTEPSETEPEPTEPSETGPEPTEPVETEPEPTEPGETGPEPTEPVETEPEPTEPGETGPEPTEPVETEPEPTEPVETEPEPTEPVETEPEPTEPGETDSGKKETCSKDGYYYEKELILFFELDENGNFVEVWKEIEVKKICM